MTATFEPLAVPVGTEPAPGIGDRRTVRRTWSPTTSFALVLLTQVVLIAASNFPTPLFPIYERHYAFSSGTVTQLFAVYAFVLIPSMLTLGRLADRIGRRPALSAGIAVSAISSVAFAAAHNLAWLFAGEVIYGLAAGLVMSCVSVAIREHHPRGDVTAGALAATLAAAAGLTLGPLVSGFLATVTPWPTVTPYALDIVLAMALAIALLRIPETKPDVAPPTRRPPAINVPREIRGRFIATAVAGATSWMLTGWVLGLSPSYLHEELGVRITQPVVAGLFAALVVATNGGAQVIFRRHDSRSALHVALAAEIGGMGVIAASTLFNSLPVAIIGAVLAGGGAGVVLRHTMATVQRIAPDHARSGVVSAYLTACYIAMSVPVIVAGTLADGAGLGIVTAWYLAALTALVLAAVGLHRRLDSRVERVARPHLRTDRAPCPPVVAIDAPC